MQGWARRWRHLVKVLPIMSVNIYDIPLKTITGEETTLAAHKDEVLLIVNTASACGFTPQYEGLEALHQKFSDQGLRVLGFPCNQFGNQEPGTEEEVKSFCEAKFDTHFPLFSKVVVNGSDAHPLFQILKEAAPGVLGTKNIKWNFTKFLVSKNGQSVQRFASATKPQDLEAEIQKLL